MPHKVERTVVPLGGGGNGVGWKRTERGRPVEMILPWSSCDQTVACIAETWVRVRCEAEPGGGAGYGMGGENEPLRGLLGAWPEHRGREYMFIK